MWSSMLMLLGNLPGNEPLLRGRTYLRHDDDWIRCVRQDIWDASLQRWCVAGRQSSRCLGVNG